MSELGLKLNRGRRRCRIGVLKLTVKFCVRLSMVLVESVCRDSEGEVESVGESRGTESDECQALKLEDKKRDV